MSWTRAAVGLPLVAVLLAACGAQTRVALPPPAAPGAAPAAAAATPVAAAPAVHRTSRTVLSPAVALAGQIRLSLARTRWPAAFDPRALTGVPEWMHDRCLDVSAGNAARCTYGPPGATRSVALVGDSIATSWLPGLRRAPALRDARIHVLTRRQCANIRGFALPACEAHHDWVLQQVRRLRPDLVIMSDRYQGGQTWQQWQAGTRRMLRGITPYAKRVVLLTPPPDSADAGDCHDKGVPPARCGRPVSVAWRTFAYSEWTAAGSRARFVDTRPWFCLSERCPALIGSLPVMFDGQHLTGAYSARLAPLLSAAVG